MADPNSTEFPVIDTDPHFSRVIRYFRPADYAVWAGTTALAPALLRTWERVDTSGATAKALRSGIRINTVLGFCGGFLLAYQNSSKRFWGWSENARERERDYQELSARAAKGLPIYGESELSEHMQGVAARNSTWSQTNFLALPWFNFVNHPYHGVDTSVYTSGKPSQPS